MEEREKNKNRNQLIDAFRLVAACLVVAIHTEPFLDQNRLLGYFCSQVITRIAVPFFFCTSGYYFYERIKKNIDNARKYIYRIAKVYLKWSIIYVLFDVIYYKSNIDVGQLGYKFFIEGTAYHFWYFVALIYSAAVISIIVRNGRFKEFAYCSVVLYLLGVFLSAYSGFVSDSVQLKSITEHRLYLPISRFLFMAIPFFTLGGWLYEHGEEFGAAWTKLVGSLVLFFVEVFAVKFIGVATNITTTITLYPLTAYLFLTLLNTKIKKMPEFIGEAKNLAQFMYCVHPLLIMCLYALPLYKNAYNIHKYFSVISVSSVSWFFLRMIKIENESFKTMDYIEKHRK